MNVNVTIDKKLITVMTVIGSLVFTLLGVIGSSYLDDFNKTNSEVDDLKFKVIRMEEKANDDKAQWQILQEQAKTQKEQDVKIQVLRMRVDEMSKNKSQEITVNIKGLGFSDEASPQAFGETPVTPSPPVGDDPSIGIKALERKLEDLEESKSTEDYRSEQMIQRQHFK